MTYLYRMTTQEEQVHEEIFNYKLEDLVQELVAVEIAIQNQPAIKEKTLDELFLRQGIIEQRLIKQEKLEKWIPLYFEMADRGCCQRRVYSYQRYLRDLNNPLPTPTITHRIHFYRLFVTYFKNYIESPKVD